MKTKVYLRIAKTKHGNKVIASMKPNYEPVSTKTKYGYSTKYYPTVAVCLNIEIPDSEFDASKIQLDAKIKTTIPCIEIKQEEISGKQDGI